MGRNYERLLLSKLNRPYMEYWRLIIQCAPTGSLVDRRNTDLIQILTQLTTLLQQKKLYLKYQAYDKDNGQLLGFFDPQRLYRGISIYGKFYRQNDTINSLVITKNPSDTVYKSSYVRPQSMITKDIKDRPEVWERFGS